MTNYITLVISRSWHMFMTVAKIMVPVMLLMHVGQSLGLVAALGLIMAPAMSLLNLPPDAAIIWVTTLFIGMYGGIASLAALSGTLELNVAQMSTLGAMMLIGHSIVVEQSIVRRAGAGFWTTACLRIGSAIAYGAAVAWFCKLTGLLTEPVSLDWLNGSDWLASDMNPHLAWFQGTLFSLLIMLLIIAGLVLALDLMQRLGITQRITTLLTPVLRLSGMDTRLAPVATVGVLLGLTYGGALIIEQAKELNLSTRSRLLALTWLSLSHSLIEDTLLFVALGANIWIVLVGRVILTLAVVGLLARLTRDQAGPLAATKTS